jgi:hypothetical protein
MNANRKRDPPDSRRAEVKGAIYAMFQKKSYIAAYRPLCVTVYRALVVA